MKVSILGSSGSVGAPGNPASGYLVQPSAEGYPSVLMDIGPGVLAKLQEMQDPNEAHVVFSHLHPDHCLDFPSLLVWRRYHPEHPAKGRNLLFGPPATEVHLGRVSADSINDVDDMSDTFAAGSWVVGQEEIVGGLTITPFRAIHPIDAYSLRVRDSHTGAVIAYSGDSAYTEDLVECARDADIFFCEATWGASSEGKAPNMHMSGAEAGQIAARAGVKKLVLIHIPPWSNPDESLEAAREHFDGEVEIGVSGAVYQL